MPNRVSILIVLFSMAMSAIAVGQEEAPVGIDVSDLVDTVSLSTIYTFR